MTAKEGGEPCPEVIDITGRKRDLVFGPLVRIPAGAWRVTIHFSLSEEAGRIPYRYLFDQGTRQVDTVFLPSGAGDYSVSLDNSWDLEAHWALTLSTEAAAFHGELRFFGATATPL